jgi:hypothetical protein
MKKNIVFPLIVLSAFLICSCESDEEKDLVNEVNKNGSIETSVSVNHYDSIHDILITKHIVWTNGNTFKTIINNDTIPALGVANTEAENEEGDTKNINVKKAYEIFITVK